ncbi:MAG: Asp-tRNA(Asn)/Glu-tRNA(Gln) amidotransferase subunit GatC [Gemmatimonadetes bacterium]|nr:Asp-tRNA(Asn)/Glu-tRNA(Gln) amidotransferase subunit GatC [Gemmatimonadota bacterium]MCB9518249.1 Asp-tRNA(Asn)/Glu-tRNA(Gln) amidotransferase subunit GatC [Gemmatimonadales bacterium]
MKIGPEEVRHVARLAELEIAEAELARMAGDLERIVTFVEGLAEIPDDVAAPLVVGPASLRLRPDEVHPIPMSRDAAALAPEFEDGFFVVPRLGGMADA